MLMRQWLSVQIFILIDEALGVFVSCLNQELIWKHFMIPLCSVYLLLTLRKMQTYYGLVMSVWKESKGTGCSRCIVCFTVAASCYSSPASHHSNNKGVGASMWSSPKEKIQQFFSAVFIQTNTTVSVGMNPGQLGFTPRFFWPHVTENPAVVPPRVINKVCYYHL